MKKVISVLLSIVLVLSVSPISTFAADSTIEYTESGYTYIVENGEAIITDCDDNISKEITLPSTLGGYPVVGIGEYAFENCHDIWIIRIPESVTYLGNYAFQGCSELMTIDLPSEGLISIGDGAFRECSWLTEITIPKSVTDIGTGVFYKTDSDLNIGCYVNSFGYTYVRQEGFNYHVIPEFYIRQKSIELNRGESSTISIVTSGVADENLSTVEWVSSNPTIVDISTAGSSTAEVLGVSAGETTITAKIQMDSYPYTMTASCKVIVKKSYIINYLSDGTVNDIPESQIKQHNEPLVLTGSPTREQYNFVGWSTWPNDTTAEYQPGDTYTEDADLTLYAVWEWTSKCLSCKGKGEIQHYCVTCAGDGKVDTSSTCISCDGKGSWKETYIVQEKHTCPICHGELVIWSSTSQSWVPCHFCGGFGEVEVDVEKIKTVNCSICKGIGKVIHANTATCKACAGRGYSVTACTNCRGTGEVSPAIYTITYDNNGGTDGPTFERKQQGLGITLSKNIPVKPGYIFCGWKTHIGDMTIVYQPGDNYITDGDNTLIAIWEESEPIPGHSCGDIDNDGTINLKDVTQLQKYLAGWNVEVTAEYCDVNADGEINLKDVTHLQKFLAGWEVELG